MAWTDLKASVAAVIKTNGNQEITGALLQSTLNSIIDQVGANASYKGVAIPSTNPGTPDALVFYIASTQGTYANFGGFVLDGGFAVLSNVSGSWSGTKFLKTEMDAKADQTELVRIESDLAQLSAAEAILIIRQYDQSLTFKGFASVGDTNPIGSTGFTYVAKETGTIFGVAVTRGQLLVGIGGTSFTAKSISINTQIDIYNVTHKVPLATGQYYTNSTARAAVPSEYRKAGLKITYLAATQEHVTLTITGNCVSSGNINVKFNLTNKYIAVTEGQTAEQVAETIRSTAFTGFTLSGSGADVVFLKNTVGIEQLLDFQNAQDLPEIDRLQISSGASGAGILTITLDGVAFTVSLTTEDNTYTKVTNRIYEEATFGNFSGWKVAKIADTVTTFTKETTGLCAAPVFEAGTTGVGLTSFNRTQQGSANTGITHTIVRNVLGTPEHWVTEQYTAKTVPSIWEYASNWKVLSPETLLHTPCFYNNGLNADEANYDIVAQAIRSIRLIGDWDKDKKYTINYITRNYNSKYEIKISEMIEGVIHIPTFLYAGELAASSVVESVTGVTILIFPTFLNRYVELEIDYRMITSGFLYSFSGRPTKWIIKNEYIDNSQYLLENGGDVQGENFTFDYIDDLSSQNILKAKTYRKSLIDFYGKKGFISFRVDDSAFNETTATIWEKYGCLETHFICPAILTSDQVAQVKRLQMRGHEIADHTPNHNTDSFTIPPGYDDLFESYIGNGISEILTYPNGARTALLEFKVIDDLGNDVTNPTDPAVELASMKIGTTFNLIGGTNRIEGDFTAYRTSIGNSYNFALFINNTTGDRIGWVGNNGSPTNTLVKAMKSDKITSVVFSANETVELYACIKHSDANDNWSTRRITLGDNATYLLFLASQLWFKHHGIEKIKTWGQPGGSLLSVVNEQSCKYALDRLGMDCGAVSYLKRRQTYCMNKNKSIVSAYNYELNFDNKNLAYLSTAKNIIAEMIAKNQVVTLMGHHGIYQIAFEGATLADRIYNYQKFQNDLMLWVRQSNIPFISITEASDILDAKVDRNTDIMPPLYVDLAIQGKPDGYVLGSGVTWVDSDGRPESRKHSLKLNGDGTIFTVSGLGGIEKGENTFDCWIKGIIGAKITIQFKNNVEIYVTAGSTYTDTLITQTTFNLDVSDTWKKFTFDIDIEDNVDYLTIIATASDNSGNDISISGMKFYGK